MKKNFDIRLAALREYLRSLSADETVFIGEGGGEFCTAEDAFTYLRKYGAVTPDGKRIVLTRFRRNSFTLGLDASYYSKS